VVADPARDNPLPGAEEEGLAVAELFESFNTLADRENWPQRFQVTRLIGSFEATPTTVLRELSVRRYDVLHYAGHCFFDPQEPERSGWIFSDGVVISAHELQRIDRVPPLVVANACESGITPDRTGERSAAMVPSFAEAFFAQGVANYVGTAWPVDDIAARLFATVLYGALLGLEAGSLEESPAEIEPRSIRLAPQPMHLAILRARVAVARTLGGRGTWGAYQHYGNPYYRLLSNLPTGPGS
jgi:CHAT domain-containing protein